MGVSEDGSKKRDNYSYLNQNFLFGFENIHPLTESSKRKCELSYNRKSNGTVSARNARELRYAFLLGPGLLGSFLAYNANRAYYHLNR